MNREIFISYAREDIDMVQMIADALTDEGYQVWWDQELEGGTTWPDELDRKLNSVVAVVVVWSTDAVKSKFVCAEAEAGLKRDVLVPVMVEQCRIPPKFGEINAIDLSDWRGGRRFGRFRKLVSAIEKHFDLENNLDTVGEIFHDLESLYDEYDLNEALREAKAGDPESQLRVGIAYQHGIGGFDEDAQKALQWMKRAAQQGHEPAFYSLGWLYSGGYLGEVDARNALKWFKRAADAGDGGAAFQISQIYAHGEDGVRQNLKLARRYCQLAADLGDEEAIEMLDQW